MPVRGVGTTTEQIKRSPPNAVYIFQGARKYFEDLGRQLGRTDLIMRAEAGVTCEAVSC